MPEVLLPLFPLGVVLLPGSLMPLHIFEERYKTMIGDAVAKRSEFGIVQAGEKGILNIGCTATVDEVADRFPDGRMNIVVLGRRRFEILMLDQEQEYLRAQVSFFEDEDFGPASTELKAQAIACLMALRAVAGGTGAPLPDAEDAQLSFRIAQSIEDLALRQLLLALDRIREAAPDCGIYARAHRQAAADQSCQTSGSAKRARDDRHPGGRGGVRQHLFIDADDTLWENNIYFEQAFDDFIAFLDHSTLNSEQIRKILDEIELANIKINGYGAKNFARNMCVCYERLAERDIVPDDIRQIERLAERIMEQPVEPIEGVSETLEYLASRHDLTLFTKGHPEEQKLKIDRSGLSLWFGHMAIVREKDPESYSRLAVERGCEPSRTWMVGNSPKSDINPALQAGLNAVYVPHARTWHLEKTDLASGPGRLVVLERFPELREYF